jgi:aromatic-L-amino-acid decarboxylase
VRQHIAWASELEALVRADARWRMVAPRTMNLVCMGVHPLPGEGLAQTNTRTRRVMEALNASGRAYCTHTLLPAEGGADGVTGASEGVFALRVSIGATQTRREDVLALWEMLREIERLQAGGGR